MFGWEQGNSVRFFDGLSNCGATLHPSNMEATCRDISEPLEKVKFNYTKNFLNERIIEFKIKII